MYDAAIIGLGPAGATLARLLSSELKVIAIDKKHPSGTGFQKPCGGLLAPDAQKALARFDITLPKEVLVDPQIFSVRTLDLKTRLVRHYQRFYMNLDRHRFDLWLQSLIPSHVEVCTDSVCTVIERRKEGFHIRYKSGTEERTAEARLLIGADGANSIVRRAFYPKKKIRQYVAIQQWFEDTNAQPFYSCVFDPESTDCYSWTISKDGVFIYGGAFPKQNSRKRFENQKQKLESSGMRFGKPLKTEACMVLRPRFWRDFCCGENGVFLIGEAAGFISPSSLEGISSALRSADTLSSVLNSRVLNPNRIYRKRTFLLRLKIFLKELKCPFMYFPPLRFLVMKSQIGVIDVSQETPASREAPIDKI